jgi:hypothetical protein
LSPTTVCFALCGALAGPLPGSASAQAAKVDLSPAAAARTVGQDRQVESTAPIKAPAADEGEENVLAANIDGLVRADYETLGQARDRGATGVLWSAMRPWKGLHLLLHKVRYWYVGRGIDAVIADDGSVAFHDKDGVVAAPLPLMDRFGPGGRPNSESVNGGSPGSRLTKFPSPGIGISDALRLLRRRVTHEDPHALERADFLERTRALRDWLDARTRDRNGERATRDMLHDLARIWSAGASLTTTQQQEQTFAMWDGYDEDQLGARGRATIVDFVHKLGSARGGCPFVATTLAGLNARRRSREVFAPCDAEATTTQTPRE